MKRFFFHNCCLHINYIMRTTTWANEYFGMQEWRIDEEWYVRIGFERSIFNRSSIYYDGHTDSSITLLGLLFGCGYGYDSRSLEDWSKP